MLSHCNPLASIVAQKRAVAMGAPKTLAEDSPAKQGNVEPVVENASKTKSPETSVKSTGEESTQPQPKDAVPQTSVSAPRLLKYRSFVKS